MKRLAVATVVALGIAGFLFLRPADADPAPTPKVPAPMTVDAPPEVRPMFEDAVADAEALGLGWPFAEKITVSLADIDRADARVTGEIGWPRDWGTVPLWVQEAYVRHEIAHVLVPLSHDHGHAFRVVWNALLTEMGVVADYSNADPDGYPRLSQVAQ